MIQTYSLQGMDLDVEQYMSQSGITRLVDSLHADFGPDFLITLAPVASALSEGANLSGFDYVSLEAAAGSNISFYNAQFYNGFGSMATTDSYDEVIADGWAPRKIVAGQVTAPANGYEYVPFPELNETVIELRDKYGQIGGIMGWEYFNSEPGGTAEPWQWAQEMTAILRPDGVPALTITTEKAVQLEQAWRSSVISSQAQGAYAGDSPQAKPNVDYMAMVSA